MKNKCLYLLFLLLPMHIHAQENDIDKILKNSFVSLSDSILIKNDSANELTMLYEMAKKKKIVAIGEVTHGTKEVLEFQKLIANNLVKSYDFKCIVLGEISLLDSYKINDFVVNQRGSVDDLMIKGKAKLQEMAYRQIDMIELYDQIQNFNKKRLFNDKIWVIGADIDEPEEILKFTKTYFREHQMDSAIVILDDLKVNLKQVYQSNKISINRIVEGADKLIAILENSRNGIDSTNMKIDMMVHVLHSLPRLVAFSSNSNLKYKMRDKFIFDNIEWLLKTCKKDKLVIIKAHNFHINKKTIYTEAFGKFPTFGEYLNMNYQQDYMSIGTEVQKGKFYTGATASTKIAQGKYKIGNIIGSNTKAQYGVLLCDSLAKTFLNQPHFTISYGTVNYKSALLINGKGLLGDAFDALIFIKNSMPYGLRKD